MTSSEAAALALKVHGAVWLAAVAAYYKYGDRIDLFDKALRGNRRLREAVRDNVATDLSKQLQPVIRNATSATSPVLDVDGSYIEHAADITESDSFTKLSATMCHSLQAPSWTIGWCWRRPIVGVSGHIA